MTREEEIKAAIVVTPDMIQFATPKENRSAEQLGMELYKLVDFIHSLQPTLLRYEAMLLSAAVLELLPKLLRQNPEFLKVLANGAEQVIAEREQAENHDQLNQN